MITHVDLIRELGGLMAEARMAEGLWHLIDLARESPEEIHLFQVSDGGEKISVVLAVSDEAKTELARRLGVH